MRADANEIAFAQWLLQLSENTLPVPDQRTSPLISGEISVLHDYQQSAGPDIRIGVYLQSPVFTRGRHTSPVLACTHSTRSAFKSWILTSRVATMTTF